MEDYVFKYPSPLEHYEAEAFTVRCFDDRFWKAFKLFLKEQGVRHIDPESVAGGAKIVAEPEEESDREFMLRELEKSIRLHRTGKVMLFTHHDCGALGGFARFDNDVEKEFAYHRALHAKARAVITARFQNLVVESYFIDAKGVSALNIRTS